MLSDDASCLLIAAKETHASAIDCTTLLGKRPVYIHGRAFAEANDPRNARWLAAVEELLANGLICDSAATRQVYYITNEGYQTISMI